MNTRQVVRINDGRYFGEMVHTFRFAGHGIFMYIIEFIFKFMFATLSFGAIPLVFLMGMPLVSPDWYGVYVKVVLLGYLVALIAAWSWKSVRLYDSVKREFSMRTWILGREVRSSAHVWPVELFSGISYGRHLAQVGMSQVVRLHSKVDGYIVDAFIHCEDSADAPVTAEQLSERCGLPVRGGEQTGHQHSLNDLRNNSWMVQRILRRTDVRGSSSSVQK